MKANNQKNNDNDFQPEVIMPDGLYMMEHFMKITGKGRFAMTQARKRGLRVVKDGRRVMVRGIDYFEYLEKHNTDNN